MNSGSSNKLYNLEVPPPPGTWEKIASALDESELDSEFPSTLYNAAVAPPVNMWQRIAATLDEPLLVNEYATKLAAIQVVPPAAVWNKISHSLDENAAVTGRRRMAGFLKYAAAAVILAFLAWGGISLLNNKKEEGSVAEQPAILSPKNNPAVVINPALVTADENIGNAGVAASVEEARNDAALEASKKTYAKLDIAVTRNKIKNAADFIFVADDYDYPSTAQTRGLNFNDPPIVPFIEPPLEIDLADRYVMLMTPDGNIIRMSKKLKELVCCVSGEDEDKDCVDQMKKWRQKIANPSKSHSPGNFMDILSMVSSLQDN